MLALDHISNIKVNSSKKQFLVITCISRQYIYMASVVCSKLPVICNSRLALKFIRVFTLICA